MIRKSRSNVSVFEVQERAIAVGDRIQFTTPWKEKGIASRETAAVEQLEKTEISPSAWRTAARIAWNLKDYNHIDHAYAMTSHSSQGMTVDRVLFTSDTTDSRVRGLVDKRFHMWPRLVHAMMRRFLQIARCNSDRHFLARMQRIWH